MHGVKHSWRELYGLKPAGKPVDLHPFRAADVSGQGPGSSNGEGLAASARAMPAQDGQGRPCAAGPPDEPGG